MLDKQFSSLKPKAELQLLSMIVSNLVTTERSQFLDAVIWDDVFRYFGLGATTSPRSMCSAQH
jgi:hypothetical protein